MVFDDFKDVISEQRMNRYLFSVNNNKLSTGKI